jgi:hypothetical protein
MSQRIAFSGKADLGRAVLGVENAVDGLVGLDLLTLEAK